MLKAFKCLFIEFINGDKTVNIVVFLRCMFFLDWNKGSHMLFQSIV